MISSPYNLSLAFLGATPGPFELFLLFVVVLLFFGPKKIPEVARSLGKIMEELRRASQDFKSQIMDIENTLDETSQQIATEIDEFSVPYSIEEGGEDAEDYGDCGGAGDETFDPYAGGDEDIVEVPEVQEETPVEDQAGMPDIQETDEERPA